MARRMTLNEFVAKANTVHSNRYDYSKSVYVNGTTKIIIVCPEHGEFEQRPYMHLQGQGCSICAHAKRAETCEKRYGCAMPILSEASRAKAKQTVQEKYGVDHITQAACVREKIKQTNLDRYGHENPMQNQEIADKAKATNIERYGVPCSMQNADVRAKHCASVKAHYGVENSMQAEEVRAKAKQTWLDKYGVENPRQSDLIDKRIKQTCKAKYGTQYVIQNADIQRKALNTKRIRHTFNTSKPEESLYVSLCEKFGKSDVYRQYSSEAYPYFCDFYIASKDLYIELNGNWTHGQRWYDENRDSELVASIRNKSVASRYYRNALTVFTSRDVKKRMTAKQNNLNYIVFWDNKLRDAELWFAMDCPNGQDWDHEYSWITNRILQKRKQTPVLSGSPFSFMSAVKYYQFDVFYKHEIELWNENACKNDLSLQLRLYYNRYMYLGKTPDELRDAEILRGFTISGIHKGYSAFDTSLMQQVIDKYDIKSVYDPCAGWGERMLCCFNNNIKYQGVDINNDLKDGYLHMMVDYNMQKQNIAFCDSADYKPDSNFDAVITCPPYGNIEIYTNYGSENLSDIDFLIWWQKVVEMCSGIKYFCFQINQKWKDRMLSVVENQGYKLIDEFKFSNNKSSHFNRRNGENTKKEFEVMLILQKI